MTEIQRVGGKIFNQCIGYRTGMAILGLLPVILSDVVGRIFSDKNNINCGLASKKNNLLWCCLRMNYIL